MDDDIKNPIRLQTGMASIIASSGLVSNYDVNIPILEYETF